MAAALVPPTQELYDSWAEAVQEFGDVHIAGSGLRAGSIASRELLDRLIAEAATLSDTSIPAPRGWVHNDLLWNVDDDVVVGFVSFRHELNESLLQIGGHIGYSVRPSRRRQGYAKQGLGLALGRARKLGIDRVLLTCDDDNIGSARTIEGAGGILEDIIMDPDGDAPKRRYWITL